LPKANFLRCREAAGLRVTLGHIMNKGADFLSQRASGRS